LEGIERFVDVGAIRTRYFEAGAGPTVLLIHGGQFGSHNVALSSFDWEPNIRELARSFHVVALDKLGQGRTDNPDTPDDYRMSAVVRHVRSFADAVGIQDFHVVGHSRGALPAARVAIDAPGRVRSCTFVDSNTLGPGEGRNEVVHANPPQPRLSRESQRWVLERYSFRPDHITGAWLDELEAIVGLPKYREASDLMERQDLRFRQFLPDLEREKERTLRDIADGGIRSPCMVVWGYNDPTAPLHQGLALFDLVAKSQPRSHLHVLNEAGHFSHREQPKTFNYLLREFIVAAETAAAAVHRRR
jgi:2-hydroxy-6-oxo-6-(2'-carboxyphenyl)-hexa-2,4-dienoate hydrolase